MMLIDTLDRGKSLTLDILGDHPRIEELQEIIGTSSLGTHPREFETAKGFEMILVVEPQLRGGSKLNLLGDGYGFLDYSNLRVGGDRYLLSNQVSIGLSTLAMYFI